MSCRLFRIGALCTLLLLTGFAGAAPALAAREDSSPPIDLELADAPLSQVVQLLIANSNAEIVFDDPEGKLADKKIRFISIKNKTLEKALEIVCRAVDVHFTRDADGIYHISGRPFAPAAGAPAAPQPVRPVAPPGLPSLPAAEPVEYEWVKVPLRFLDPSQAVQMLGSSHFSKPRDQVRSLDDLEIQPGLIDPATGNWYLPQAGSNLPPMFQSPSGRGRGGTSGQQFGGGFGGGGLGGGGFGGGGLGGGGGGFGGGLGGLGGGLGGLGSGGLGGLGGIGGGGLGGLGGGGLGQGGGLLPDGIEGLLAYQLDNSLIVRGTPDAVSELKQVIRLIDIPPRQLSIKIEQIAVQSTYNKSFGIDWGLVHNDISITAPIGLATGGTINVGILGENWRVNFAAAEASGKASVIDSITVTTLNNTPAFLTSGTVTFAFLPIINQVQGAGLVTQFQPVPLQAQNQLFAIPRVNGDGTITMFIPFILSRFLGESVGPDGTRLPNLTFTQLFAIRRVASGQTIVVGGIVNRQESTSTNGIPILKDLPFIGGLFRNKLQNKNNNESLFFFTPTLLNEGVATGDPDLVNTGR